MTDAKPARFPDFSPPSPTQRLKEMRVLFDVARAPLSTPQLLRAPTGDGRPMFVLPGFVARYSTQACMSFRRFSSASPRR